MIFVVYLGHEIFYPIAVFWYYLNQLLREVCLKLPNLGNPRKNVAHLRRSTRPSVFVLALQANTNAGRIAKTNVFEATAVSSFW